MRSLDLEFETLELKPIPASFFRALDFFIQHPEQLVGRIVRGEELATVSRLFLILAIINSALYGAVMGASNLLQGAQMETWQLLALMPITGIKVPALFLLTLLIVFPPIYVSNAFSGARLSFGQLACAMLGAVAMASTLLASLASVAFFFSLTTMSYDFIKLLHVAFFMYAGVSSLDFLMAVLKRISFGRGTQTPVHLRIAWLFLFAFVGTQLAWVLRPFISSPNEPFQVFRSRSGSFYESVGHSTRLFLTGEGENKEGAESPQRSLSR